MRKMRISQVAVLTLTLLVSTYSARADEGVSAPETPSGPAVALSSLEGGQTGKVYFESTSPYDFKNILDGNQNDPKVIVFGVLTFPEGAEGEVPAVVFVHGSSGWLPKHERYLRELHRMGVATFRLDSFTPRGVHTTVGSQVYVTEQMMIADAFNALKLLATHPRIDPERIGIMGASKGGAVALYTAWELVRKASLKGDLRFALHLPLYPPCAQFEMVNMTGAPVRILIGEADEWTPAKPCIELTEDLKAAGYDAEVTVYPGAYHGFDSSEPVRWREEALNTTKCRFKILDSGITVDVRSGLRLDSLQDRRKALAACTTQGVLSGRNDAARDSALKDVRRIVTRVLKRRSAP